MPSPELRLTDEPTKARAKRKGPSARRKKASRICHGASPIPLRLETTASGLGETDTIAIGQLEATNPTHSQPMTLAWRSELTLRAPPNDESSFWKGNLDRMDTS